MNKLMNAAPCACVGIIPSSCSFLLAAQRREQSTFTRLDLTMYRTFWSLLALTLMIFFLGSCTPSATAMPTSTPVLLTKDALNGTWKSEYGFFFVFDAENGRFSGSNNEQAAAAGLGIPGTFDLHGDQLSLVEDNDSDACPGLEGLFAAVLTNKDTLRLTIIEDPCVYRIEGLFQGGRGGHRLLEFRRIRE